MSNFDLSIWVVPIIAIGYLIYSIYRIILHRRLAKERENYERQIKDKIDHLQKDISNRSRDLHDSMQIINQEYSQLMKSMNVQQKQNVEQLKQKIQEHQEKMKSQLPNDDLPLTKEPPKSSKSSANSEPNNES